MSKRIIVANWKMNPTSSSEARKIFTAIKKGTSKLPELEVYVCPPFVFLPDLVKSKTTEKVALGTQDLFYENAGAYTGQVSPKMVREYKTKLAILGHSERRALGEDNVVVGKKARHVISEGMTALVCVGEGERNDEGGYYTFVRDELEAVLTGLKRTDLKKLILAYEPIWAIGKRAEEALDTKALYEMVLFIRKILIEHFGRTPAERVPILYGGSVKASNAHQFVTEGGVNGLLVGSASLNPKEFITICKETLKK